MNAEQYLKDRIEERIHWYDDLSERNLTWYKRLRVVEVACAALIPLFAGLVFVFGAAAIILGVLGIIVAVTAGVLGLYQFQQRWLECRSISEALRREKYLCMTQSAPYDGADQVGQLRLLVQRVENLIVKENNAWLEDRFAPRLEPRRRTGHSTDPQYAAAE
jgi:hypothetical protein